MCDVNRGRDGDPLHANDSARFPYLAHLAVQIIDRIEQVRLLVIGANDPEAAVQDSDFEPAVFGSQSSSSGIRLSRFSSL